MAKEIPSKAELDQSVRESLQRREKGAPDRERAALVRIVLGLLRMMIDPTGGPPATLATTVFGTAPVPDQTAQRIVDYWLDGIADNPPFPQRPQMRPILVSAFETVSAPVPADVEIGVLVNVCIGLVQDRYPDGPKAAKQGVAEAIGGAYTAGA